MNSYWLYNITQNHSEFRQTSAVNNNTISGYIDVVNFDTGISTSVGDNIVTLNKNGVYYFNHYGEVTGDVETSKVDLTLKEVEYYAKKYNSRDKYPQKYLHTFPVVLKEIHEKLEDYLYSLISIENYINQ